MANLAFVQQKLFLAHGIGIEDVALLIRADVHAADQHFAVFDDGKTLFEVHPSLTHAFDFCALEFHAAFQPLLDEVIVERFLF